MDISKVKRVKKKHEKAWLKLQDVVSVGIGLDQNSQQPVISIGLRRENAETRNKLPDNSEGIPVKVTISGDVSAL